MPKRVIAHHQAAVGQLLKPSAQREIRLLGDPRESPIALTRHKIGPAPAHLQRRRTADSALALRPLHDARHADHERPGCRTAGLTRRDRRHHPLAQVQRISSSHPCWPPSPASRFEFDSRPLGNPPRFSQSRSRARSGSASQPCPGDRRAHVSGQAQGAATGRWPAKIARLKAEKAQAA